MLEPATVYLSLGSNMGNREANLDKALGLLRQKLKLERVSSIYDTAPQENVNQPRFLNTVCQVTTTLAPQMLLALTQSIETSLGRTPKTHNLPRPIDIDILFYNDNVIDTPELTIPHTGIARRAFVLIPLAEIAPDFVHPVSHKTITELLNALGDTQGVIKWSGKVANHV